MDFNEFINENLNEAAITLKRKYTELHPAKLASTNAKTRNKVIEAIKDGKLTKEEFNLILTKVSEDQKRWLKRNNHYFNLSEDGVTLSNAGLKIYSQLQKETKTTQNKISFEMNRLVESFSEFVENLNGGQLNESFASSKLASLLVGAQKMPKDLPNAFYHMSKLALDKIQDVDIIEMDPETAKKEKRANAVYFYFTTNEKENPYSASDWSTRTIAANTLLAITDGQNEWMNAEWNRYGKGKAGRTLKVTKRDDSAGINKSSANSSYGSKISSLKQVVELADRAYCLDLDILRARYSTSSLQSQRADAKRGATAFQNDKDFKAENIKRYNDILATKAAELPLDSLVSKAIETIADQIKDGIAKGLKGRYDELIVGLDPKGREVKMNDAANLMRNLLDEYSRYCGDAVNQEKEVAAGYGGSYYEGSMRQRAKNIQDYLKKVDTLNYAW
jgi:hypothetical protein